MSLALAYGTSSTYVGKIHEKFILRANELFMNSCSCLWIKWKTRDMWASQLHPKQWADKLIPSFSAMTQISVRYRIIIRFAENAERDRGLWFLAVLFRIRTTKRFCRFLIMYSLSYILQFELDRFLRLLKFEKKIWLRPVIYVTGSRPKKIPSFCHKQWSRSLNQA